MTYFVIVRGPLGAGKTTISQLLAKAIPALHIDIDRILEKEVPEEWVDDSISERSFIRANEVAVERAWSFLANATPVIFDQNFYYLSTLEDLIGRLKYPYRVFTLDVPLEVCIERDLGREISYGRKSAEDVYRKSTGLEYGIRVDANRPVESVVEEILDHLPSPSA